MKLVVVSQSCLALPLIHWLYSRGQLQSVWVFNVTGDDSAQLISQCQALGIRTELLAPERLPDLQQELMRGACAILSCYLSFIFPAAALAGLSGRLLNIHASALPEWRGPEPLFWQIYNGIEESALTLHIVTEQADRGAVFFRHPFRIHPFDTHSSLNMSVAQYIPELIQYWLEQGGMSIPPVPQQEKTTAAVAKRPEQRDLCIDWRTQTSLQIFQLCRACNGVYGGALLHDGNEWIRLLECTPVSLDFPDVPAGTILHIGHPQGVLVACRDGALRLDVLQAQAGCFSAERYAVRMQWQAGQLLKDFRSITEDSGNGRNVSQHNEFCG